MLYGSNAFHLNPPEPRNDDWITTIGNSVQHIRTLTIGDGKNQKVVGDTLKGLKAASSLEQLIVHASLIGNYKNSKTMANGLYPLILHLHRSRKDTSKKPALEMLQIGYPLFTVPATLNAEVGDILKKRLKC